MKDGRIAQRKSSRFVYLPYCFTRKVWAGLLLQSEQAVGHFIGGGSWGGVKR